MQPTPQDVALAARGWLGTRFQHQGRVKKTAQHPGGVDCIGLLVGVARELGLRSRNGEPVERLDKTDYPHFSGGGELATYLQRYLSTRSDHVINEGDVLLFNIKKRQQHVGIVCACNGAVIFVHAYAQARKVVETELRGAWRDELESRHSFFLETQLSESNF